MATTRPAIRYSEPNGLPPPSTLDTQTSIITLISSGSTLRNCAALCGHGWVHRGRHIAQAVVRLSPRLGSDNGFDENSSPHAAENVGEGRGNDLCI